MNAWTQIDRFRANLAALGARKLSILAAVGLGVVAVLFAVGYFLSKPTTEILYSGLDRGDVADIGGALRQAGVPFDVDAAGTAVYVPVGQTALARMTLAERGLPRSGTVGNELYDKLGSLGLTSFMQEVTRVRALEGELARSIQMMRGIKAARVHIVMADPGSFRRERQAPSASVVIRTDGSDNRSTADAIRHMVAAAVPSLKLDEVTVLNVDGRLLASGPDSFDKSPETLLTLQRQVTHDIREKIDRTLSPYLNPKNFQVSVAAYLNTDQKRTNETIFDPDGQVSRTVRVIKEKQTSQNAAGEQAAGVDANLPKPKSGGESKQSNDDKTKREEVTNYEISSKSITTTTNGYSVDRLSIAVLINRATLASTLGGKPSQDAIAKQVGEIEQLVANAAGIRKDRGDTVKISVVDFSETTRDMEPVPGPSFVELIARQAGTIFNGLAIVAVVLLLLLFGVRPALRMLSASGAGAQDATSLEPPALAGPGAMSALDQPGMAGASNFLLEADEDAGAFEDALLERRDRKLQRQLEKLVDLDEEHAAAILSQWIREEANA